MPQPDAAFRLQPFRGVRYRPGLSLAAVTAPPYDVLDDEAVAELTAAEPHNIVRLVLPQGVDQEERTSSARNTLQRWLADGTLVVDDRAALYVYQESQGSTVRLRGLIGALGLHDPADQVVLPHEDVMPWPVEDRAALQTALEAHAEPIWLVYDGGGAASAVVDAATSAPPLVDAVTADGLRHRLWAVTDPGSLAKVRDDLAGRQALIADGHHRYAAYRVVQAARHAAGDGAGPWDLGLALLVDLHTHAPEVGAIHRVVRGLSLADVSGPLRPARRARRRLDHGSERAGTRSPAARRRLGCCAAVDPAGSAGAGAGLQGNGRRRPALSVAGVGHRAAPRGPASSLGGRRG